MSTQKIPHTAKESVWGGELWPELVKDVFGHTHALHATARLLEVGWMKMVGKRLRKKNDLEPVQGFHAIAEF